MKPTMRVRLAAVSAIGAAALLAAGVATTATAADTESTRPQPVEVTGSTNSEQAWDKAMVEFDKCLAKAGIDETVEPSKTETPAFERAFEKCEAALPDEIQQLEQALDRAMNDQDLEKAMVEFDKCLAKAGIDETVEPSKTETPAFERAFEKCEAALPEQIQQLDEEVEDLLSEFS